MPVFHLYTTVYRSTNKYSKPRELIQLQKESESCSVMSDSLVTPYSPLNSPCKNTGTGSLPLLQGIFPTQGSNPDLLHCRRILYQLSHKGSPRILAWVAFPFSRGSSQPRDQTQVFCIAGGFFTSWAIREAHQCNTSCQIINSKNFKEYNFKTCNIIEMYIITLTI